MFMLDMMINLPNTTMQDLIRFYESNKHDKKGSGKKLAMVEDDLMEIKLILLDKFGFDLGDIIYNKVYLDVLTELEKEINKTLFQEKIKMIHSLLGIE